ncbi:MAG: energy transducer TonB [Deltaproteobacteria bacterium]|nr:energy transducer TonB [Deltaproteobacteria bacterium]
MKSRLFLALSVGLHLLILSLWGLSQLFSPLSPAKGGVEIITIASTDSSEVSGGSRRGRGLSDAARLPERLPPGAGEENGADLVLAEIRKKIEQTKRYPAQARQLGQEGVTSVSFSIDRSGKVSLLSLEKSSSYRLLDEEALETIRRAAPFPPYEKPIRLAIRFSLAP